MNLMFDLSQQQTQKLAMTVQMRQALQILEFTTEELESYVAGRAEGNVFLQMRDVDRRVPRASSRDEQGPSWEEFVPVRPTVREDVKHQIRMLPIDYTIRSNALRLVDDLDANGYLEPYSHVLGGQLGLSESEYEEAVCVIQFCSPLGIGARNLSECLQLQLPKVPESTRPLVQALAEDGLEALAEGKMTALAKRLKCTALELEEAVFELRRLNPRPGAETSGQNAAFVRPDLFIERIGDELSSEFAVIVGDESARSWKIDEAYLNWRRKQLDPTAKEYLGRQWQEARWLRRCIVQRGATLQRIGEALILLQRDFLQYGVERLRPMTLQDVSEVLEIHESTVSRAIRNKMVATPHGLVDMKWLFSARLQSSTGGVSAEAIKYTIRQLIRSEDTAHPLTDAQVEVLLREQGIQISRRTIAKYRDAMGIAGAVSRKRVRNV